MKLDDVVNDRYNKTELFNSIEKSLFSFEIGRLMFSTPGQVADKFCPLVFKNAQIKRVELAGFQKTRLSKSFLEFEDLEKTFGKNTTISLNFTIEGFALLDMYLSLIHI